MGAGNQSGVEETITGEKTTKDRPGNVRVLKSPSMSLELGGVWRTAVDYTVYDDRPEWLVWCM